MTNYNYLVNSVADRLYNKYRALIASIEERPDVDEKTMNSIVAISGIMRDYTIELLSTVLEEMDK
jgi:hypothetical protein